MDVAQILKVLSDGGFGIIEFVIIWFLWRELIRSRKECEQQISRMQRQQVSSVAKIAKLEGQIETITRATIDFKSPLTALAQRPTTQPTPSTSTGRPTQS